MSDSQHSQSKIVLVGDDEQWYVEPLKDALEYKGYHVIVARSGSDALSKIIEAHPNLVILDVMMDPGELKGNHAEGRRTGRVVLEKIRKELGLDSAALPVICLTVLRDDDLRDSMTKLGAEFLCKEDAELADILKRVDARLDGAT